jgi:hypothetical protein
MTTDEDRKTLAEFSTKRGAAHRLVVSHKEDIARWIEEGWSTKAIYHLLKTKGIAHVAYVSFRKSVKKIFSAPVDGQNEVVKPQARQQAEQTHKVNQRLRPHEMQRQQSQKFVTMSGVDHIGLDKKDE